ncbi:hypothetical protein [Neorhizobium sp. S3-V5DH]|uniref:hypothetical protein n=1 Tax=Neorhizobium sp. S3-V5DH TaxID=2485166 RepID=UPI00104A3FE7|nr:hypothetical protein [Neorhizobium sp. S3-V5DH]TCV69334.1 hypothetical protein EDE09_11052 [Neorhizobium sp. S3-V5DH]
MGLSMPTAWRFGSPGAMEIEAVNAFNSLVHAIASQSGSSWDIFELFKAKFSGGYSASSSESWAISDLQNYMVAASSNAATFISAFWDGCEQINVEHPGIGLPDADVVNRILFEHGLPFEVRPPSLLARNPQTPVAVQTPQKSVGERATELIHTSLDEADRLLLEQRPRQAVQEILWLLETVSTAFQGQESGTGTVEGKYFNEIIRALRSNNRGSVLSEALGWMTKMHGFLSSPGGGGVRHGTQLAAGISPSIKEAHLYCNLTRSYINYLLAELADGYDRSSN